LHSPSQIDRTGRSRKEKERQLFRKSFTLLALALAAAAVAAPTAQSNSTPKVDPLAVGYLMGQGLSPSEVTSWTVGACSHKLKAASCYAMLGTKRIVDDWFREPTPIVTPAGDRIVDDSFRDPTRAAVAPKTADPLAVGYLIGQGLSPSQVTSWTVGACSHRVKDASCYAMFPSRAAAPTQGVHSTGFQWGDAGIGAGFTLGIVLLLGGAGAGLLIARRNGRQQAARAA
jgi:hypothetical protein